MHRAAAVALPTLVILAATSACSDSGSRISSSVVTYARGFPAGMILPAPTATPGPSAMWAGPRRIYLTTYGSSSCPDLPTSVSAAGAHRLDVKTKAHLFKPDTACTSDLGPTTSTVKLPAAIDITAPITIQVNRSDVTLYPH